MPGWAIWIVVGLGIWFVVSVWIGLLVSRSFAILGAAHDEVAEAEHARPILRPQRLPAVVESVRRRILLVDDDGNLHATADFRGVYCSLLEQWLGEDATAVIPGAGSFSRPVLVK